MVLRLLLRDHAFTIATRILQTKAKNQGQRKYIEDGIENPSSLRTLQNRQSHPTLDHEHSIKCVMRHDFLLYIDWSLVKLESRPY